jgi:hypothetical protein
MIIRMTIAPEKNAPRPSRLPFQLADRASESPFWRRTTYPNERTQEPLRRIDETIAQHCLKNGFFVTS